MSSLIAQQRLLFHANLLAKVLSRDGEGVATNADKSSALSVRIAGHIAEQLKSEVGRQRLAGQTSGNEFEGVVETFLRSTFLQLGHLRPGTWQIAKVGSRSRLGIAVFEQHNHLIELARLAHEHPALAVALGSDYLIAPDVVIVRKPEPDEFINRQTEIVDSETALLSPLRLHNTEVSSLHASISCKWTLRSDRAQNAKSEALNLIRNRKGCLPHVVAVTGEPLPSRISSLALGTGDLDCVYHFALPELVRAVEVEPESVCSDLINVMISGKRLKDIADLPLDLAI